MKYRTNRRVDVHCGVLCAARRIYQCPPNLVCDQLVRILLTCSYKTCYWLLLAVALPPFLLTAAGALLSGKIRAGHTATLQQLNLFTLVLTVSLIKTTMTRFSYKKPKLEARH